MAFQTLAAPTNVSALGGYGATVGIRFDEIVREMAVGYDKSELVGATAGVLLIKLNLDFLDDSGVLTVVDVENSSAVTNWSQYIWKFFIRRKQDGDPFYVSFIDPATGAAETTKLFKFVDQQIDYNWFQFKLYSTGLQLRQYIPLV